MLDLLQLRCFVVLAQELHFSRAAARLHMSQPPLSRHIQMLEHEIGARLFERTSRSVSLTPTGRSFQPDAIRILELCESAVRSARRTALGETGLVSIGFTGSSAAELLPTLLIECRKQLPDVEFKLAEMVTGEQSEALLQGRIDLGLLRPPIGGTLQSRTLLKERLMAALPLDHPAASGPAPALADFSRRPFIMYSPYEATYFYDLVSGVFREAEVAPDVVQHVAQIHTILSLVRAGMGAALVPESACIPTDRVCFRSVLGLHRQLVEMHLAWKVDNPNPALLRVLAIAKGVGMSLGQR